MHQVKVISKSTFRQNKWCCLNLVRQQRTWLHPCVHENSVEPEICCSMGWSCQETRRPSIYCRRLSQHHPASHQLNLEQLLTYTSLNNHHTIFRSLF